MNDKLISCQAAINIAMQYCPDDDGTCSKGDMDIRELLDDLENLPSAQPERKTGHWIFCDTSCKCSICGEDPMTFVETTGFNSALMDREYPMRFCPNCGAKMEVENG